VGHRLGIGTRFSFWWNGGGGFSQCESGGASVGPSLRDMPSRDSSTPIRSPAYGPACGRLLGVKEVCGPSRTHPCYVLSHSVGMNRKQLRGLRKSRRVAYDSSGDPIESRRSVPRVPPVPHHPHPPQHDRRVVAAIEVGCRARPPGVPPRHFGVRQEGMRAKDLRRCPAATIQAAGPRTSVTNDRNEPEAHIAATPDQRCDGGVRRPRRRARCGNQRPAAGTPVRLARTRSKTFFASSWLKDRPHNTGAPKSPDRNPASPEGDLGACRRLRLSGGTLVPTPGGTGPVTVVSRGRSGVWPITSSMCGKRWTRAVACGTAPVGQAILARGDRRAAHDTEPAARQYGAWKRGMGPSGMLR
jgi:hypothetical protein